jgi:hypothetical protein
MGGRSPVPLVSSPDSVRGGRPSLLAVVETVVASGFSLWLAWNHKTVEHIVIASALAPFLLLRTRLSTRHTIRALIFFVERIGASESTAKAILVILLIPIIKVICSVRVFFKHPMSSINMIPENFYKNVFVIKLCLSSQLIPGAEEVKLWLIERLNIYSLLHFLVDETKDKIKDNMKLLRVFEIIIVLLVVIVLVAVPLIIMAISFRFTIKSTSLFWLPLLWVIHQARPGVKVLDRIELNIKQPWSKLMVTYLYLSLSLLLSK